MFRAEPLKHPLDVENGAAPLRAFCTTLKLSLLHRVGAACRREVLGMTIGASEAEPFWTEVLRDLVRRGLSGVKLVISESG